MNFGNQTVREFVFLSFQNIHKIRLLIFFTLLFVYLAILLGNFLIITIKLLDPHLQSPMYFFLSHLSLSEIVFTTNIVPNMLDIILHDGGSISLGGCVTQLFIFSSSTTVECFLLSVMSYDRYLAICSSLHYSTMMTPNMCWSLISVSWITGFLLSVPAPILINMLIFCSTNIIDHFFCDLAPILQLSCSDTSALELEDFVLSFPVLVFPFVFIISTYIRIVIAILKIPSTTDKKKAFSTCSSHLMVVFTYYGTLIIVYMSPTAEKSVNKVLALLYTIVTPLLNPIIYSLRNQDIRNALTKLRRRIW